jgi:hypothetical protein
MKLESKFYNELKRITPKIRWTRLENTSVLGTPDVLGYNSYQYFFTVELKIANGCKVRLSPHQISFHILHPKNAFILVKTKADCHLYSGSQVRELFEKGLSVKPIIRGLRESCLYFENIGK